jgi:hypothetical protein
MVNLLFQHKVALEKRSVTVTHIVLVQVLMLLLVIAGSVSIAAISMLITVNSCWQRQTGRRTCPELTALGPTQCRWLYLGADNQAIQPTYYPRG